MNQKYKIKKWYIYLSNIKRKIKFIFQDKLLEKKPINIDVMSIEETIDKIKTFNSSIIRYGDGEIMLINNKGIEGYQESQKNLRIQLEEILLENTENLLVCLPDVFNDLNKYVKRSKMHWTNHLVSNRNIYLKINNDIKYGNSFVSRPYIIFKDKSQSNKYFNLLKSIWNNRDIVIVEGDLSRNGIGNDLFNNAKSIKRIICPSRNAFDKLEEIKEQSLKISKKTLFLISLGPTAKLLAYYLHKEGYQVIDIGHIDSEYEWYLAGVQEKTLIKNKHCAEISDERDIEECQSVEYSEQIVAEVK